MVIAFSHLCWIRCPENGKRSKCVEGSVCRGVCVEERVCEGEGMWRRCVEGRVCGGEGVEGRVCGGYVEGRAGWKGLQEVCVVGGAKGYKMQPQHI